MLHKSLWGVALTMVAGLGLLLTPGTGESRGGGGHGGGGHGGGHGGGFHGGGFHGGGFHGGGFHGGGFHRGFYGGGFYGGGYGYPYYGGWDWGSPYYGWGYDPGYYGYDYAQPSYYGATPSYYTMPSATFYYAQPFATVVPPTGYYGSTGSASPVQPSVNPNDATFTVRLPDANAEVWFQDYKTRERGSVREFESAALQPGKTYHFQIRARWNQNGQPVEQTRDVPAQAGRHMTVDFQQRTN